MQRFKVVYRRYQDPLSIRTWGKGNWTQLLLANQFAQFVGWGGRFAGSRCRLACTATPVQLHLYSYTCTATPKSSKTVAEVQKLPPLLQTSTNSGTLRSTAKCYGAKPRQGCVTFQWARSLSFQLCHRSTDTAIQSSLSSTEGCVTFQCSFTEYDHGFTVWKLDVLGRDVIIGIICVLRAASSSTFLRVTNPGVLSDQTIDARS